MTKGLDIMMKDKSRRSSLVSRKIEIGEQRRRPHSPSTLEQKKALASNECKKVPIYSKPTISFTLYAQNHMKQPSFDKIKLVPQSKLMSIKSKLNEKNVSSSYIKIVGSTKPKDVGKPYLPLNSKTISNKKQTRQPAKGLESKNIVVEKKPRLSDDFSSSKDNHIVVPHEEDDKTIPIVSTNMLVLSEDSSNQHSDHDYCDILNNELVYEDDGKNPLCEPLVPISLEENQDMVELNTRFDQDNVTLDEIIKIDHIDDHGCEIHQQDQAKEIFDGSNDHLHHPESAQETEELENKQVVQVVDLGSKGVESVESKVLEHEENEQKELGQEEPKPKEVEIKQDGEEVPKEEEHHASTMLVENQKVVAHGKKDTATYNYVIEGTVRKLQEQRTNRVKTLVGAFESVISRESVVLQKPLFHINSN